MAARLPSSGSIGRLRQVVPESLSPISSDFDLDEFLANLDRV